jgi:hypothetical protein
VNDNRYFRKFWRNVVRWLTENSIGNRRLIVDTDRIIYRPGQPIEITAQAYDESMQETLDYQLKAQLMMGEGVRASAVTQPMVLVPAATSHNYTGNITLNSMPVTGITAGELAGMLGCTLEVVATKGSTEIARTSVGLQLLNDSAELLDPRPQPENLTRLAEATGGAILQNAQQLTERLRGLPTKEGETIVTRSPTWDRPFLWLVIIVLLGVEWSMRRRAGFG